MLGVIIGGFIILLTGLALLPTLAQSVGVAQNAQYVDAASSTILGLCTLFFGLVIAVSAVGIAAAGMQQSGLI